MPIVNKTKRTAAIYNHGREVVKVYDHGKLAWQKSIPDYLCFTALESGTFTLTIPAAVTPTYLSYIEWSKDGRTWNHTDNTSEAVTIQVDVASGDKVYWRGSGVCMNDATHANIAYCSVFTQTEDTPNFVASGNLVSLIALSDFDYIVRNGCAFANLFFGNEKLTNAETLILPMFNAAATYLFYMTFKNCSNLVKAPILNLTRTTRYCCFEMFRGTALTTMPELPDIALSDHCYSGMFRETNIEKAVLPSSATTLVTSCYSNIFFGCTHLKYVKCLATDISATDCLTNWLYNVSSTGTFIQAEGVEWPRGASGIPTGWLAYDEGEEIPNDYTPCDYIFNPSSASAAAVAIGTTSGINEPFEVDFQATEIVASDRPIAGYGSSNKSVSPVQGSMSYFYLRNNPDSFQHQVFRLNTSGDTIASTNGLLKNGRDLDRHTAKVTYTYNESMGHYLRNLYFDGVLTHSSTTVHPTPLIGIEFYVFGFSSSSGRFINGKIYGLRRWEEDEVTLKAKLIPCSRNSDGAAGFWDTAQEKFFTSTYWTAHFDNE